MSAARELWEGLTQPSLPALVGALAVALAVGLTAAFAPGEGALASGVLVADEDDEFAWITARALRAGAAPPAAPGLWVLGSSALREALTDEEGLRHARFGPTGGSVTVLTAGGLYPQEMLALLDHLPVRPGDTVALEISPRNLALAPEGRRGLLVDPRLPLASPAVDAVADSLGDPRSPRVAGSSVLSFPNFWSARLGTVVHLLTGPPAVSFHLADALHPPGPEQLQRLGARLAGWGHGCARHQDDNLAFYGALVEYVSGAGARPVLVVAPRNRSLVRAVWDRSKEDGAARQACTARIEAWAEEVGAPLLDPTTEARIPGVAFIDHAHVVDDAARRSFTAAFARALGALP